MEQQDAARLSTAYLRFAEDEVRDKSPLYGELLRGVASDREVIGFLLTLPTMGNVKALKLFSFMCATVSRQLRALCVN